MVAEFERVRGLSMQARAAAGFSAFPLTIETTELRSRRRVNVVLRAKSSLDAFSSGDPVVLGPMGNPDDGHPARVDGVDDATIELRVDEAPEGPGPWVVSRRLDLGIHDQQAAHLLAAERLSTPLANLLLGFEKPYLADPYEHSAFDKLNPTQRRAAELAFGATEVGLIHGPPGTGKTEVLVALLRALADQGEKPWALADSNAAVDHLCLRASTTGLNVVRLGVSARISSAVQPLTLEWRILNGPREAVIRRLMREASRATGEEGIELRDAIRSEWANAKREVLASADVLAMTLGTLHTRGATLPNPRTVVVDEASQVTEPALWLLASRCKRLILAGDPHQLGPVVISRDPVLEKSLLQRLVEAKFQFPMLAEQYRFNDDLLGLVNPTYDGKLASHGQNAAVRFPPAVAWIDTSGMGYDEGRDALESLYNEGELDILGRILSEQGAAGFVPGQVAIITPYRAQLERIRRRFPAYEAGTVNAFQGRECDVVVVSFVRSNPAGELGFVADPRRLNVAVSRARHRFIGIGDTGTLGNSKHFSRLIDGINALGGYRSGWEFSE